jgi:16S rRNA (adenine1518-N6/adenine1519-N6)-dimethyltransferase
VGPPVVNLASPATVQRLLRELGVRPSKSKGQNFLIDRNVLNILLDAAPLEPGAHVIEIGPGLGIVTEALAERGARVAAIEKDRALAGYLRERFRGSDRVYIVAADALNVPPDQADGGPFDGMVANLPYAVASRLLVQWTLARRPLRFLTVTIQLDVARRLAARPGDPEYGPLTVWCGLRYATRLIKIVKPSCFLPRPKVDSAIVRLERRAGPVAEPRDQDAWFQLVKHAFSRRRKTLLNALPAADRAALGAALRDLGFDPTARPETLSSDDWVRLSDGWSGEGSTPGG